MTITEPTTNPLTAPTAVPPTIWRAAPDDTKAIKAMDYAANAADGTVFDLTLAARGVLDPYMTPCPAWCDRAGESHDMVATEDSDRMHYGGHVHVPVRSIDASYHGGGSRRAATVTLGSADLYLQQNVREVAPTIWLGKGETSERFELTLDEAEAVGRTLLALVEAAR